MRLVTSRNRNKPSQSFELRQKLIFEIQGVIRQRFNGRKEMAKGLGTNVKTIDHLMLGDFEKISLSMLVEMCYVLDLNLEFVVTKKEVEECQPA